MNENSSITVQQAPVSINSRADLEESILGVGGGIRALLHQKPPLPVRFGSTAVFVMLLALTGLAASLHNKDSITIRVRIETGVPPISVFTPRGSRIVGMLVRDGERVSAGQPLATLSDPAAVDSGLPAVPTEPAGDASPTDRFASGSIRHDALPIGFIKESAFGAASPSSLVLRAPASGEVSFLAPPEELAWVPQGRAVLAVVRKFRTRSRAYGFIPVAQRGRIKVHQRVRIEVPGYPKLRSGWLEGSVERIAAANQDGVYFATIALDQDLLTTRGVAVTIEGQAEGQGEIVVGDRRILDMLFSGLKGKVSSLQ